MATHFNHHDNLRELKAFDETKAGVKGLVDAGITKVPHFFIHPNPPKEAPPASAGATIPVIDLAGPLGGDQVRRRDVVAEISAAAGEYGFFQVVNHGIEEEVLEEMLGGARRFFEQDVEVKKEYYTRDSSKTFVYNSNKYLYTTTPASWKDTFVCVMTPPPNNVEEIPLICREIQMKYSKQVMELAHLLLELLSEALGLPSTYLKHIGCADGHYIVSHYSPPCPEPDKTLSTQKHFDLTFITLLLQDHIGGLQVLHHDPLQWIDVPPVPGALILNIGELLQLLSNDKFKSVEHRVLASRDGPRVSVASFFNGTRLQPSARLYGPIKELVSEKNPAKYRETTIKDYIVAFNNKGIDGSGLAWLRV